MKLAYFIIIVIIIYAVASQIKVVHVDSLPTTHKQEVDKRSKIRSMLVSNYIKEDQPKSVQLSEDRLGGLLDKYSSEQFQSTDYRRNFQDFTGGVPELPNSSNLLYLIRSEYVDDQYKFNIANLPVTTRNNSGKPNSADRKYLKFISRDIDGWNELFYKYFQSTGKYLYTRDIKILFVRETEDEFFLTVNVSMLYLQRTIHFQLTYYGQKLRSDDIINEPVDEYNLQLVDIKPIPKSDFDVTFEPQDVAGESHPFMSMADQMKYVDRIRRMHQTEYD